MSEPIATHIRNTSTPSGKAVQVWRVEGANNLEQAQDAIPGDYLLYWHVHHEGVYQLEIIRTF